MTPQEAYNKGLDDAEILTIVKFSNALIGNDDGPFNNPQMEDLRQQILNRPPLYSPCGDGYTLHVMLDEPFDKSNLNSLDHKVIEILEYVKSLVGPKPRSRISVKIKKLLTDLEVDFIQNYGKLN
jgi:hypothetical protein